MYTKLIYYRLLCHWLCILFTLSSNKWYNLKIFNQNTYYSKPNSYISSYIYVIYINYD